jgi:hypothetical protein
MQFILEFNSFYTIGDIVYIEFWYKPTGKEKIITPVKIKEKRGNKYLVSHNVKESKIQNAPDELIKKTRIISKY